MKKIIAVLVALVLTMGLFTAFAGAVDASDVLDFKDANSTQIGMSLDVILWNGGQVGNRVAADAYLSEDGTLDAVALSGESIGYHGWVCFKQEVKQFGYMIDDKIVFDSSFWFDNEPGLVDTIRGWGGDWANGYPQRFLVTVPFEGLTGTKTVCAIVELADGTVVKMNDATPGDNRDTTYAIKFPAGSLFDENDYTVSYFIDKTNATNWSNGNIGEMKVTYYFKVEDDGLAIAVKADGLDAGNYVQLNFNPGNYLWDTTGQFVSFVLGDTLTALQHNHANGLLDDPAPGGADITSKVNGQIVKTDSGFEFTAKLPKEIFTITDVAGADAFVYGQDDLYFGMFLVAGGGGLSNQKNTDYTDWTCKGLNLNEYVFEGQPEPATQPTTGDMTVAMFAVIAVLALGAAVVFAKKRAF